MNRIDVLEQARELVCNDRQEDYGDPVVSFKSIARFWNGYLESINRCELIDVDIAAMMVLLKVARSATGDGKLDCWIDIAGYAAIAGELGSKQDCAVAETEVE